MFNRVTDLGTTEPIAHMVVSCEHCGTKFEISGDSITPAFQMLLLDCYPLLASKQYMYCILNVCQSYEMFFNLYFRSRLYRAWKQDGDLKHLNRLLEKLHKKTEKFTFAPLRNNFLNLASEGFVPLGYNEVKIMIDKLDKGDRDSSKVVLDHCSDGSMKEKLEKIQRTDIHRKRNKVVHDGYRPHRNEAEHYLKEAREVLFEVPRKLDVIDDDLNMYR